MITDRNTKDATITFRTNQGLKKKLEEMAAKNKRTLSNLIELLLEKITKEKKWWMKIKIAAAKYN